MLKATNSGRVIRNSADDPIAYLNNVISDVDAMSRRLVAAYNATLDISVVELEQRVTLKQKEAR